MIRELISATLFCFIMGGTVPSVGRLELPYSKNVPAQELTGSVAGKIELRAAPQIIRRERGGRYQTTGSMSEMNEHTMKRSEQRNVVLYLEGGMTEKVGLQNSAHGVMDQQQAAFIPHVLAVQKGSVVDFVNHDETYHNVFSLSPAKKFNIGRRPTGEKVPVQFDKSGVVQVFCDIHSQMTAFVVVLDSPFFVQPEEDGSFRIDHVPPGTYTLKVWHERLAAPDQKITVTAGGTTKANLVLE